jgi:hypothetical protein
VVNHFVEQMPLIPIFQKMPLTLFLILASYASGTGVFVDPSNAALEWQARRLGWRSRKQMAACPLEGLVS